MYRLRKGKYIGSISFSLYVYWLVLVVWQNSRMASTRGSADVLLKMGLLVYLMYSYISKGTRLHSRNFGATIFMAGGMLITLINETFSLSTLIAYVFPILFLILAYGLGNQMVISKHELLCFLKCIIVTVLYAAGYAVIFCWDQFASALTVTNAYGNELKAFFYSSHEFAMYLLYAIVSCVMCIELQKDSMKQSTKYWYVLAIVLLAVCMVLTYSRTAMAAAGCFVIVYLFLAPPSSMKRFIITAIFCGAIAIICSSGVQEYIFKIILKENNLAGRDTLADFAAELFMNGSITQQVFGYGSTNVNALIRYNIGNGSFHNAYLQILLNYGVWGIVWMVGFILQQISARWRMLRKNRFVGAVSIALVVSSMMLMMTNTTILFTSPIDSYFMTMFSFVVPKYVCNAIESDETGNGYVNWHG